MLPTPERSQSHHRSLIAVAEDDDDFRELIVELLRGEGHQVIELEDGFELLDYVHFAKRREVAGGVPDLVITDLRMPGADGLDVAGWGRLVGMTCPILVLTAFPGQDVTQRASDVGGVEVLSTPIEASAVLEAVRASHASRP
jgi:two-component system C4-dicarboxylate transport response regulator DctD